MIYIGIDPAIKKPHAYSVWVDGKLRDFGKIEHICSFWSLLTRYPVDLVLFEDQYLKFNYKTAKELTFATGKLAGICDYLLINYEIVNVATWISRWGLYKHINPDLKGNKRRKAKIDMLIQSAKRFGNVQDEDEASAILIPYVMKVEV